MSSTARVYLTSVYLLGVLIAGVAISSSALPPHPWLSLLALGLLSGLAARSETYIEENIRLNWETLFLFAGLFLLPFWMFGLLSAGVCVLGLLSRQRTANLFSQPLALRPFILARDLIAGRFALLVFAAAGGNPAAPTTYYTLGAVLAAALAFAAAVQILTCSALYIVHGISWRDSRMLRDILLVEFPLASAGYCVVLAWNLNPWLMLLFLTPLVLVTLMIQTPQRYAEQMLASQHKQTSLVNQLSRAQKLNAELFKTIGSVTDARDPFGGGHAHQVAVYASAIAKELNLTAAQTEDLRCAAYLHDIGKMTVPEALLNKPNRLSDAEYAAIQQHAAAGSDMLTASADLRHLAPFVRHHHERWDGLGYPDGLAGDNIPLEARILHVCDSVETMASDRSYRTGLDVEQIIAELRRCRSTQFDPLVADVFIHIVETRGRAFVVNAARQAAEQRSRAGRTAESSKPARAYTRQRSRTS